MGKRRRCHVPSTAIGRAVEALGSVPVSYEQGAAVSDVEAGNFSSIVGSNPKVAFMPPSASTELAGDPDAIAAEIAREAEVDGTLIVLVGRSLGSWSNEIGDDRLRELVREAQANNTSSAAMVESLVRNVQAEPTDGSRAWSALALLVVGEGAIVVVAWVVRRERA